VAACAVLPERTLIPTAINVTATLTLKFRLHDFFMIFSLWVSNLAGAPTRTPVFVRE